MRGLRNVPLIALVAVYGSLAGGCARSGPAQGTLHGRVTLDGADIVQGSILLVPAGDNQGVATGGPIVQGRYELRGDKSPSIGTHRVEIRSIRKSGRMMQKPLAPPGEMVEADEEAVAARFNTASTLSCVIKQGDNVVNFDVQSR